MPEGTSRYRPVDGAVRTPPEGVNLVKAQMDAALERSKKNDPAYNQSMERGPIDVEAKDPSVIIPENEKETGKAPGGKREAGFDLTEVLDHGAAQSIAEARQERQTLDALLQRYGSVDISKNLNIRQLEDKLVRRVAEMENMINNPHLSAEARTQLEVQIETIQAKLSTVSELKKMFAPQPVDQARRSAPAQTLRRPAQRVQPQAAPVQQKSVWDRIRGFFG